MSVNARFELITPEKAQEYLTHNTHNFRTLSSRTVASYASDMANGFWQFNGEPIQFAEDGTLLNGQHRLHAIVKSGKTIGMMVVTGLHNETDIFDFNKTRSPASVAKYHGIANSNQVMAVSALMISKGFTGSNPNKGQLLNYSINHTDDIEEACRIAQLGGGDGICKKASVMTILYCLFKLDQISVDDAISFCKVANSGNVDSTLDRSPSPALMFRKQVVKMGRIGGRAAQRFVAEIFYKALMDFKKSASRNRAYKDDTSYASDLIQKVAEMDERKDLLGLV